MLDWRKQLAVVTVFVMVAAAAFAGGSSDSSATTATTATAVTTGQYGEAPMLAQMVAAGTLPPVDERLPDEPIVVEPFEGIGKYGGTLRDVYNRIGSWRFNDLFRYQRLMKQNSDLSGELVPDLATGFEISEDSRVYTIHLRPGLKWSDGAPFTVDDITFWHEIYTDSELRPLVVGASDRRSHRNPLVAYGITDVRKVDDRTFQLEFARPTGIYMWVTSLTWAGIDYYFFPREYLSQFHAAYQDEEGLNKMASEEGYGNWQELFAQKAHWFNDTELPSVAPWVLESVSESYETTWVRNPYYYKVDPEGNQLPYIDRIKYARVANQEAMTVHIIGGNVDIHSGMLRAAQFPVVKQNERIGGYRVAENPNAKGGEFSLFVNQTTADPRVAEIFQDLRFRQAFSLAMNRQEIIDTVFFGKAEARQASPTLDDPAAMPEWSEAFVEYDPARANQLLDEMGLEQRGSDGFRLGLDGQPIEFVFDWDQTRAFDDAYALVAEYLQDVGLKIRQRTHGQRATFLDASRDNARAQIVAFSWVPGIKAPDNLLPFPEGFGSASFGRLWGTWFDTDGAQGVEPPDELKRVKELIGDARASLTVEEYVTTIKQAMEIHKDNLYVVGVFGNDWRGMIVSDRMRNLGDISGPYFSVAPLPAGTHKPETWWIDE